MTGQFYDSKKCAYGQMSWIVVYGLEGGPADRTTQTICRVFCPLLNVASGANANRASRLRRVEQHEINPLARIHGWLTGEFGGIGGVLPSAEVQKGFNWQRLCCPSRMGSALREKLLFVHSANCL